MVIETDSLRDRIVKSFTALIQQPLRDLKNTIESKAQAVQKWTSLTEDLGTAISSLSG